MGRNMLLILGVLVVFISSETITQCVDNDLTEFHRVYDEDGEDVHYCYKFISQGNNFKKTDDEWYDDGISLLSFSPRRFSTNKSKAWKDGARMNSIHSDDEWATHTYIMGKYSGEDFWVGLIKGGFIGPNTAKPNLANEERCSICSDQVWMDKTDDDCSANNWLNDNIVDNLELFDSCTDQQKWCWYHSTGNSFKWTDEFCDDINKHGICKYKFKKCGSFWADTDGVCNNHGRCEIDGVCSCEFLYSGNLCETTHTCYGTRQDDENVCNNNGNCTSPDNCECLEGYFGNNCNLTTSMFSDCDGDGEEIFETSCYIKYGPALDVFEAQDNCSLWGGDLIAISSYQEEVFLRDKFEFFMLGLIKNPLNIDFPPYQMWPCTDLTQGFIYLDYKTPQTYPVAKGNRIRCTGNNLCFGVDDKFFWTERDCEKKGDIGHVCKRRISQCSGILANDPNQCNKRGYCEGETCKCYNGYEGTDCGTWKCFGIFHDFDSVTKKPCSGHGVCKGPNSCVCDDSFGGVDCSDTFCDGIISTRADVCHGHGECVDFNVCKCDSDYGGDNFCRSPYPTAEFIDDTYGTLRRKEWNNDLDCVDPTNIPPDYSAGESSFDYACRIADYDYVPLYGGPTRMRTWIYQHEVSNINNRPMSQYEAEEYASEEWYLDKGRLFPIRRKEHRWFLRALRLKHTDDPRSRDNDIWTGVRKRFGVDNPSYNECRNTGDPDYFECLYNVPNDDCEADENQWLDNIWFNTQSSDTQTYPNTCMICNTPTVCVRQMSYTPMADMECEASVNWAVSYHLHWCDGIEEDQKDTVCNGNGFCWEDDVCSCKGTRGYVLPWCETRWCNGVESIEDNACSGNGDCVEIIGEDVLGRCDCLENWYGENCNITLCDGKWTNETDSSEGGLNRIACSGHGVCYAPDKCFCGRVSSDGEYVSSDKYFGDNCEKTYCNFISSTDNEKVCSSHGRCYPHDVCVCNSTEDAVYSGQFCEVYECFEEKSTDFAKVCNGGGDCVDIDVCDCIPDRYWGEKCEVTECFGYFSNDTDNVCSGRGRCLSYGICTCDDVDSFGNCSVSSCFGIFGDNPDVCSGHGDCISQDNCSCTDIDFVGVECGVTTCGGISGESENVCWGRGDCIAKDVCECDEFHYGIECANFTCDGVFDNQTSSLLCFDRGDCVGPDTCECTTEGYDARTYCENFMCYEVGAQDTESVCNNGEGVCVGVDDCDCTGNADYFGKYCTEKIDSSLDVEYIYDFIGGRRMLSVPYTNELEGVEYTEGKSSCFDSNLLLDTVEKDGDSSSTKWFGEDPQCEFGNEFVLIELEDEAPLLVKDSVYLIELVLQTVPTTGDLTYTYTFIPESNEADMSSWSPGFEDNNDEEEEIEDDDDEEDDNDDTTTNDDGGDDDDDQGENDSIGVIIGVSSGSVLLVLLFVFLCGCYWCVCGSILLLCCLYGVFVIFRKVAKNHGDEESAEGLVLNWTKEQM